MSTFKFTGEWTIELELEAFAGFQSRGGVYSAKDNDAPGKGRLEIEIEDELNGSPDPLPGQLAAINYLITHQTAIVEAIQRHVFTFLPEMVDLYDLEDEPEYQGWTTGEEVKKIMGFARAYVQLPQKEGVAYIGLEGGANWDEEHGVGVLLHKDRIVDFGGADVAFSTWKAYEDSGTYDQVKHKFEPGYQAPKVRPVKHQPHPKYGKLTPAEEQANQAYEYRLIETGYNEDFIALVEQGILSADGQTDYLNMTFIARACQFNNEELVRYLLQKGAKNLTGCLDFAIRHDNLTLMDQLLAAGAEINETNYSGDSLIRKCALNLMQTYTQRQTLLEKEKIKNRLEWLIRHDADPYLKNKQGKDAFDAFEYLDSEPQISLRSWLKAKWRNYQG